MCGIAGLLHFDSQDADRTLVGRMTRTLAHRGPDGEGVFCHGPFGLGHRRLSIIDLSDAGIQPMCNEDQSIWLTFNGEIYNFQELRKELIQLGHHFQSRTDSEVILHAYEEWGTSCLERFNGMFAFVIADLKKGELWLVRDRMGVKPLFYYLDKNKLLFGSEIKAVLAYPGVQKELNEEALAYFLALNYTPAPHTLFKNIQQLLPGQWLRVDRWGQCEYQTWWDMRFEESQKTETEWTAELIGLLDNAVATRLISDVPFGAFLSGGIDSSTVSWFMAKYLQHPLKTFTVFFEDPDFDEHLMAREFAKGIGAISHDIRLPPQSIESLPTLIKHSEEPTADSSMLAVYFLAQETRRHVKMVLSGDGLDELFAGYETYTAWHYHRLLKKFPPGLISLLSKGVQSLKKANHKKVSFDYKLKRFLKSARMDGIEAHAWWRTIFDNEERRSLLAPIWNRPGTQADIVELYRSYFKSCPSKDPIQQLLYVDTRFYLPNDMLVKMDRMTMAHGLEAREPMLDCRLVEFAGRLPSCYKLNGYFQKKYLVKKAMMGKLPKRLLFRKKAGFNIPNSRWMKEDAKDFVLDHLSPQRIGQMGFLDAGTVRTILENHWARREDNSHKIWGLLTLSLWWHQHFLNPGQESPGL